MVYPILIITMKIYIDGLVPDKIKCSNFQNYLDKKLHICRYYTNEGIFESSNDRLYKLVISDKPIERSQLKGLSINLLLDTSTISKGSTVFQIPPDYVTEDYQKEIYILRRQSKLALTLHRTGNEITDAYIETTEDLENEHFYNDYVTLISLLTNINQ